ncbi:MAG: HNH endonuclease [Deltaproteobacteria bacterium]|uniref:HNH endonuclease n=1 Tax=Desulfobacula sp. TaxID=2593537 RepID=UPI0019B8A990|nr:HNH endonuclease [Candidatus Desulfobacula maris]MBL6996720.1 HNH endonuclease [Desulfobacula sp.]
MSTYQEKLKDPRWQKKRLEIIDRDGWKCSVCGDNKNMLAVHHCEYMNGNEPWDYPGGLLVTLCEKCHSKEHSKFLEDEINDFIFQSCGFGILKSDISNLFKVILEQGYGREKLLNLTNNIRDDAIGSGVFRILRMLKKIELYISSNDKTNNEII